MKHKKRNRLWALALAFVLIVGMLPGQAAASAPDTKWTDYAADSFAGGNGTKDDPYQIAAAEQLAKLAKMVNSTLLGSDQSGKYFKLTADIDLSAHRWIPIGYGDANSTPFSGFFDGSGKTITGMVVDETANKKFAGLFGVIGVRTTDDAAVKNLTIENASVTVDVYDASLYYGAGILAGNVTLIGGSGADFVPITNCHVSGSVTGGMRAGGFVGAAAYARISDSSAEVTIKGYDAAGGFVGTDWCGSYENCEAFGTVESSGWSTGGFVGYIGGDTDNPANIKKCFTNVDVSAADWNLGGFAGYVAANTEISNSVAYGDVTSNVTDWCPKAGGFTGTNMGRVSLSHALGTVTENTSGYDAGGFVGSDVGGITSGCSFSNEKNPGSGGIGYTETAGNNDISDGLDTNAVLANICRDYYGNHQYGQWVVTMKPDYKNPGQEKHTCTVCGEEETREIAPLEIRDLLLNKVTADEGDLIRDGYHWDTDSKTLTLSDSAWFGTVVLPENDTVTVVTNGENHFNSLSVAGDGIYGQSYKMDVTISGNGTLTVEKCISGGMDGDALTVDNGAELVANGGISIGASGGVNSTVTVKGKLWANNEWNAIYVGKVVVESTGELYVSGKYGVTLNGMSVNDSIQYDGVFTIKDGGSFSSECNTYAVCIFTNYMDREISDEEAGEMIVLPDFYLPSGYEVRAVKGSEEEWGTQYGITIAEKNIETKFQEGELVGAAGSISLLPHNQHDFSGAFDAYDENGHWHVCHREGCNAVETPAAHSFTNYIFNNDATYFADGTETAVCNAEGCEQTHTRVKTGTMLKDATAPTGEIKVKENSFKSFINTITFGIFCKDKYDVTITGKDDETGIKSIAYYISETAVSEEDIAQVTGWQEAVAFSIAEEGKYIIYARITDNAGNVTYIGTNGMVLDKTSPMIGGLTNGKTYCAEVTFTVADENIDYVTVNGEKTTDYRLKADGSTYQVKAVDKAGNESPVYQVTVRKGHTGIYHEAVAATCTEAGNIEYWTCSVCGKYFADQACTKEITKADTVTDALEHDFSGAFDAYDENGHWHVCHREGCNAVETPAAHSFTNYVFNNDATYFADGTETAVCDAEGCEQTHTRVKTETMLKDVTAPTGEIKVKENSFKSFINTITFGIFCKDKYDVTITGKDDETGIKSIAYYISETAVSEEDIAQVTGWQEAAAFSISVEGKYIIYARITDNAGNVTYISTNGMVLDKTSPLIGGLTNGKTYCAEVTFTVADENIDYVTVNGEKTTDYRLKADGSTYQVKAVDKAGNESLVYEVTVKNGHTYSLQDGKCTICGLTDPDFKPDTESSGPQTGDSSNFVTWIVLLLAAVGIVVLAVLVYRKKGKN